MSPYGVNLHFVDWDYDVDEPIYEVNVYDANGKTILSKQDYKNNILDFLVEYMDPPYLHYVGKNAING